MIGCKSESEICGELEGVHYLVNHYYTNMDKIDHTEYFNENDQILRWWKPAEEIKNYKYDDQDKLIEIQYSRTCQSITEYEYKIYDDKGKLIGEHYSRVPILNKDSLQTKFYNKLNNEESEIADSQTHFYGDSNLIDSTIVFNNGIKTIELNKYDNQNRLISKSIRSETKVDFKNSQIKDENIIFDNLNHKRTYEYKDKGKIKIEKRLDREGKSHLMIITEKIYAT